jgi:hypothetical protein
MGKNRTASGYEAGSNESAAGPMLAAAGNGPKARRASRFTQARTQQSWPALMNAATAARYLGERSPRAFCRRVGNVYPEPATRIAGRGKVWRKTDLDDCVASLGRDQSAAFKDIADVL